MKKSLVVILAVLVVVGGIGFYVCSKVVSNIKERTSDIAAGKLVGALTKSNVKIEQGGKTVTVNGVTVKQGLPDNFPKDFPMYADAKVTGSMGKGKESTTTISIPAPTQEVSDFYAKNLPGKGWTVKENTFGELTMLEIAKGDLNGNVTITKDKSQTILLINFKPAK